MKMDYCLYLVTDRGLSQGRSNLEIIRMAVRGGATAVQLREKEAVTREFLKEALLARAYCHEQGVAFIINDRIDIAQAVDADGVHLGQDDMPIDYARKIIGYSKIIGISAFDVDEAVAAENDGADYLGVSPIFTTSTKPELEKAVGLEGLRKIRKAVKIPLVGIGSMNQTNAYDVIRAGADGVAVISGIVSADDPGQAASEIKREILRAREDMK
jgi:thiamine-phosphate pyrophosphorylase